MGLGRDRTRQAVRGLGLLELRQVTPTPDTDLVDIGILDVAGSDFNEQVQMVERKDENGNLTDVLESGRGTLLTSNLAQVGIDEMNLIRNSRGVLYQLRYSGQSHTSGLFQCFAMEQAKLDPSLTKAYKPQAQTLPFKAFVLHQEDDASGFSIPDYYLDQVNGPIVVRNMRLSVSPDWMYGQPASANLSTAKLYDLSSWANHGALSGGFTLASTYARFNGTSGFCSFGDVLDDDGVSDFGISIWLRIQAANGTEVDGILAKKTSPSSGAGLEIYRSSGNVLKFVIYDGSILATLTGTTLVLQNVWNHLFIAVDRNGSAQMYLNGAAEGSAASVSAIESVANALSLQIGKDNTSFGQVDVGRYWHWIFGANKIETSVSGAAIAAQVFAAERGIYGV